VSFFLNREKLKLYKEKIAREEKQKKTEEDIFN
jgi:hypothetical protein